MTTQARPKKASRRFPAQRIYALLGSPWLPIALLAATLFVSIAWVRRIGDFGVETDFYGTYAPRAREIASGQFDLRHYGITGPLYEVVLALGIVLGIPVFTWAKIVSALSILASSYLWTRIAGQAIGQAAGRWIPWLLLISPTFVRFGYLASSDALYCFLFSLAILVLVRSETTRNNFRAGLAALVAFLARYQALIFPGFAFLWWIGRPRALRRWATYLLAFPGLLVILLLVASRAGVGLPKPDFLYNVHYEVSEGHVDWDDYQAKATGRGDPWEILRNPGAVLLAALSNVPDHLESELLLGAGPVLGVLALVGLAALFVGEPGSGTVLRFAGFWVLQFLLLLPTQASERYALTQIPLLALMAAWGLATLVERLHVRPVRWAIPAVGVLLLLGLALNTQSQIRYQKRQPRFLLETASQLEELIEPQDRIMTRKPHLPFLLNCRWVYFPDAQNVTSLRTAMLRTPADYVYYGRNEMVLRPNFRFLLFPPYRPPEWKAARADSNGVLYRIGEGFFTAEISEDDGVLRQLENATLSTSGIPVAEARRLAAYLTQTRRCQQALREYDRIRKFATLTAEEERNVDACRAAQGTHQE